MASALHFADVKEVTLLKFLVKYNILSLYVNSET